MCFLAALVTKKRYVSCYYVLLKEFLSYSSNRGCCVDSNWALLDNSGSCNPLFTLQAHGGEIPINYDIKLRNSSKVDASTLPANTVLSCWWDSAHYFTISITPQCLQQDYLLKNGLLSFNNFLIVSSIFKLHLPLVTTWCFLEVLYIDSTSREIVDSNLCAVSFKLPAR